MVNALSTRSSFLSHQFPPWLTGVSVLLSHSHINTQWNIFRLNYRKTQSAWCHLGIASNTHILTCKQGLIQRQLMTGFIEDAHTDVDWTQESEWIFRKPVQVTFNLIFKRICIINLFFLQPLSPFPLKVSVILMYSNLLSIIINGDSH